MCENNCNLIMCLKICISQPNTNRKAMVIFSKCRSLPHKLPGELCFLHSPKGFCTTYLSLDSAFLFFSTRKERLLVGKNDVRNCSEHIMGNQFSMSWKEKDCHMKNEARERLFVKSN